MSNRSVIIVTGAGSGIGRATAVCMAQAGWAVLLSGRTREKLQQTAAMIRDEISPTAEVAIEPADLTDAQQCETVVATAQRKWGRIDALANIAGFAPLASIEATSEQMWRKTIDTNLSAVVYLTRAVWPVFKRGGGGVIVNVSSMASIDPFDGFAAYAAAKAGVNMFTRVTAREGRDIGVGAVAIAPGAVETPMLRSLFDEKAIPPSQCLRPEQVAAMIRDCISGEREFEPGGIIEMTGADTA